MNFTEQNSGSNNSGKDKFSQKLRKGITTGSCAAAAAKAALIVQLSGNYPSKVNVCLPEGEILTIPIAAYGFLGKHSNCAWVRKDAGDDSDSTHGILIGAKFDFIDCDNDCIKIFGGFGVGKASKPGLPIKVGESAINPVPRKMITENVRTFLPKNTGAKVTITVPDGKNVAKKTLNSKLGIINGISILGTTGIVEPMSEQALHDSLRVQLHQIKKLGYQTIVMVPGRSGEKVAISLGVPEEQIAITSNFIGQMLREAAKLKFRNIIITGHAGKISKLSAGIFNTQSKIADARREIFTAHASLVNLPINIIRQLWDAITTEECIKILQQYDEDIGDERGQKLLMNIAQEAEQKTEGYLQDTDVDNVSICLTDRPGNIISYSQKVKRIAGKEGWPLWEKLQ